MPLPADLLEILICPQCKGGVETRPDHSAIICRSCKLIYAVADGIPNLLISEAAPLEG